jgi:hypothetical protein
MGGKRRGEYNVLAENPSARRPLSRPKRRWENITEVDL